VVDGDFAVQQMDGQTFFFRRTNTNALGELEQQLSQPRLLIAWQT
jgi:hypothetical protein